MNARVAKVGAGLVMAVAAVPVALTPLLPPPDDGGEAVLAWKVGLLCGWAAVYGAIAVAYLFRFLSRRAVAATIASGVAAGLCVFTLDGRWDAVADALPDGDAKARLVAAQRGVSTQRALLFGGFLLATVAFRWVAQRQDADDETEAA